ncbi:MAG: hypothetical protein ACTSWN_02600 [Promethearchaeota archaeon]
MTYTLLVIRAFYVAKKAELRLDRISMQMIGTSGLLILLFLVFFALDVLNLFGLGNMSVFYFIA